MSCNTPASHIPKDMSEYLSSWISYLQMMHGLCNAASRLSRALLMVQDKSSPCYGFASQCCAVWDEIVKATAIATASVKAHIVSGIQDMCTTNLDLDAHSRYKFQEQIICGSLMSFINLQYRFSIMCCELLGSMANTNCCRSSETAHGSHDPDCSVKIIEQCFGSIGTPVAVSLTTGHPIARSPFHLPPTCQVGRRITKDCHKGAVRRVKNELTLEDLSTSPIDSDVISNRVGRRITKNSHKGTDRRIRKELTFEDLSICPNDSDIPPNRGRRITKDCHKGAVRRIRNELTLEDLSTSPIDSHEFSNRGPQRRWSEAAAGEVFGEAAENTVRRWSMPWETSRQAEHRHHWHSHFNPSMKLAVPCSHFQDRSRSTTPDSVCPSGLASQEELQEVIHLLSCRPSHDKSQIVQSHRQSLSSPKSPNQSSSSPFPAGTSTGINNQCSCEYCSRHKTSHGSEEGSAFGNQGGRVASQLLGDYGYSPGKEHARTPLSPSVEETSREVNLRIVSEADGGAAGGGELSGRSGSAERHHSPTSPLLPA